jgi:hypothetical protein
MIQSFIWAALILAQILYWSFLRRQTEVNCETYWKAHLLRLRGPISTEPRFPSESTGCQISPWPFFTRFDGGVAESKSSKWDILRSPVAKKGRQ